MDLGHGLVVVQLRQTDSPDCLLYKLGGAMKIEEAKPAAARPVLVTGIERAVGPRPKDRTCQHHTPTSCHTVTPPPTPTPSRAC